MRDQSEGKKHILALRSLADIVHHQRAIRSRRKAIRDQSDMQQAGR